MTSLPLPATCSGGGAIGLRFASALADSDRPMGEMVFKQRFGFDRRVFCLEDDGVVVSWRSPSRNLHYKVEFDQIRPEPVEITFWSTKLWIAAIISLCLTIGVAIHELGDGTMSASWFWLVVTGALALAVHFTHKSQFVFSEGDYPLAILKGRPRSEEVAEFVGEMLHRRQKFLAEESVLERCDRSPADAIHKLAWLHSQGVLSEMEYEILKFDVLIRARGPVIQEVSLN